MTWLFIALVAGQMLVFSGFPSKKACEGFRDHFRVYLASEALERLTECERSP